MDTTYIIQGEHMSAAEVVNQFNAGDPCDDRACIETLTDDLADDWPDLFTASDLDTIAAALIDYYGL